jgi:hypothetical protein
MQIFIVKGLLLPESLSETTASGEILRPLPGEMRRTITGRRRAITRLFFVIAPVWNCRYLAVTFVDLKPVLLDRILCQSAAGEELNDLPFTKIERDIPDLNENHGPFGKAC